MKNIKKKISLILGCVMMANLLVSCNGTETQSTDNGNDSKVSTSSDKRQLNVATELMSDTLEPADAWNSWFTVRWGIGETLFKFNDDYSCEPWLAESCSIGEDNLTWIIKLKDGIKFSNGNDMTASKVVASIERLYNLQDPSNGGDGNPQGYLEYSSITANDDENSITIVTKEPTPDLEGCFAYPWTMIIDVDASEGYDKTTQSPICTGPYVVTSFTQDSDIQLARNEYYWDGEVPFDTVNVMKVGESSTRSMALQDGSADMVINLSATDRQALQSDSKYNISSVSGARLGYAHINMGGILGNDAIRQAVMCSIDGETITNVTTNGSYTYGYSVIPSSLDYGYDELTYNYSYNPDKAIEILDNANIIDSNGDGFREVDGNGENVTITYYYNNSRQMDLIAQAQASQIENVGIKVNLQQTDSNTDIMKSGNFDLVCSNEVTSPTGDPTNFLSHWYSQSTDNYSNYKNDEFDKLYSQLQVEFDNNIRRNDIIKLQQILLDDCAVLTYGYYNFNICSTDTITGAYCPTSDFYWITKDIKPAN
ncbi:MAG: ABC transporter substrate-binding protein [Oscillospiraceae bacterium]